MGLFEWDERKNLSNLRKHGIDFYVAGMVFDDPQHLLVSDRVVEGEDFMTRKTPEEIGELTPEQIEQLNRLAARPDRDRPFRSPRDYGHSAGHNPRQGLEALSRQNHHSHR